MNIKFYTEIENIINILLFSIFFMLIYFLSTSLYNSCAFWWEIIYNDKMICSKVNRINELNELKLKNDKYKVINNQLDKIEKELNE